METLVATAFDLGEGQVIASRLRAEGIPCRVQSEALGPFVVNVGSMARVDIFVPEEFVETAREILDGREMVTSDDPSDR